MKKIVFGFLCLSALTACDKKTPGLSEFKWLEGEWSGEQEDMKFYEVWAPAEGNKMSGKGIGIAEGDTVFSERITLEERGEDLIYTANVSENGTPVEFKFTGYNNDSAVFENPQHDFPQRILYFHKGNELFACIDGKQNGDYNRITFTFSKSR